MGQFTQIRGWIEVSDDMIPAVEDVIANVPRIASSRDSKAIALYQAGWHIGPVINWTRYVFFGADVKSEYVDVYKEAISALASLRDADSEHPVGLFFVDVQDGSPLSWRVFGGAHTNP
jgi:hypothetical protein